MMIFKEWIDKIIKYIFNTPQRILNEFELRKSNYGRDFGWFVEFDKQVVGELTEPVFEDMFWMRYTIIVYPDFEVIILDNELWDKNSFQFRNKKYNQYAENAFSGTGVIREKEGKFYISMRRLYLSEIKRNKK